MVTALEKIKKFSNILLSIISFFEEREESSANVRILDVKFSFYLSLSRSF